MPGRTTTHPPQRTRSATRSRAAGGRRLFLYGALLLVLLSGSSWAVFRLIGDRGSIDWQHANVQTLVSTDVTRWLDDTTTHQPLMSFAPGQSLRVDPAFAAYYSAHAGETLLGTPLTPAFPMDDGMIQFFRAGALLLPTDHANRANASSTALAESVTQSLPQDDVRDESTGIICLALLPRLLSTGSTLSIAGGDGSISYVDLRRAALPDALVLKPAASGAPQADQDVFIPEVKVKGSVRGHLISHDIWTYMTRPQVSPDGWQADFGVPLTEAVPFTMQRDGVAVQARAQAFVRGVVYTYPRGDGQVTVEMADLGSAYLDTLGPPSFVHQQMPLWATQSVGVGSAPGNGNVQAHLGRDFALSWSGEGHWVGGDLWYHVGWQTLHGQRNGWVPASAVTFTSPGDVHGSAEFDALTPDLEAYLNQQGPDTGAVLYDLTHGHYYIYNANTSFIMASSAKVPIMLTFFTMVEQQQRQPNGDEVNLLTAMIEHSDNDAAQALFDEIGGTGPMEAFMRGVGIDGFKGNPDAWGWSTITPLAMVRLLTLLHDGKVLNSAQDRQFALQLMENIEPDQQVGVGDTAPANATVAMKDGWVQDADGLWAVNTSGIVTVGGETYVISVYTQRQNDLVASQDMLRHVCGVVAHTFS